MNDVPLFDLPAPAAPAAAPQQHRPVWTRVDTRRPCDWCTRSLAQAAGDGPRPEPARWTHSGADGDTLLCYRHGQELKADEQGGQP